MSYTLGQAAHATGLSKTAIANAIKKGRLSAQKDAAGQYAIDPAELHRVYPQVAENRAAKVDNARPETIAKIAYLEGKLQALEQALIDLKAERNDWKEQAEAWREESAYIRKLLPATLPVVVSAPPSEPEAAAKSSATAKPNRGIFGWLKARAA